jgi:hypothetical protein
MNLGVTLELFCQNSGTQTVSEGRGEERAVRKYLRRKQSKLDRVRRRVAPPGEDRDPSYIRSAVKEVGHWSPAPEDVESLNRKGYKSGMKKQKQKRMKVALHTQPGAVPWQDIQGQTKKERK